MGDISREMGRKGKKAAPRRTKKRRQPAAKPQDGHQPRRIPLPPLRRAVPRGYECTRGGRRAGAIRTVPKHASRGIRQCRSSGTTERHSPNGQPAAVGKRVCAWTAGIRPTRPPSGADFKTGCNDPKSSRYPTAELRIDGLSKMPERCCCPKRCTCQGFAHLPANRDSTK